MKTEELKSIEPKEGTISGSVGTVIRYSIEMISRPDLTECFGNVALSRGVFKNDIAVISEGKMTSGRFVSSVNVIDYENDRKEVTAAISGTYSIEPDYRSLLRILRWKRNLSSDEAVTREDFRETYGQTLGDHYYEKWVSLNRVFEPVLACFCDNIGFGQSFIGIIMNRVYQYEQRISKK